jgi:RNA polymerase subunit RPABC4/transcription elongation factor Spt4
MKYQDWIERERRYRIKLFRDWPEARDLGIYRVCQSCAEICLCAEDACPNCGSVQIGKAHLELAQLLDGNLIRCQKRYEALFPSNE